MHFNCHNQQLTPFRPAGIALVIEKLLVGCAPIEDALAAAFCLLRHAAALPSSDHVIKQRLIIFGVAIVADHLLSTRCSLASVSEVAWHPCGPSNFWDAFLQDT